MKDRPNRSSRPISQSGRPRSSQRGGRRAPTPQRGTRSRQLFAVGALALVLVLVAVVAVLTQQGQSGSAPGTLPGEEFGHALGSASAPVAVTEWSDFQ